MYRQFFVKDGKIHFDQGSILRGFSVIYDTSSGLISWGESELVEKKYEKLASGYSKAGCPDEINHLMLVHFNAKMGLSLEEICIFANFLVGVSANMDKVVWMFGLNKSKLKEELARLHGKGF